MFAIFLLLATAALATVFGTVRGIVHDPQHRPVQGIEIVLTNSRGPLGRRADSAFRAPAGLTEPERYRFR